MRIAIIAILVSFLAGAIATVVLKLMIMITDLVWSWPFANQPLYIFAACTTGGVLIGFTRVGSSHVQSVQEQIDAAADPLRLQRRQILMVALGAALAVGFGGAIGPEAGLIAAITELAALVSMIVARSAAEARTIGQASISAALAGLYASPPGGFAYPLEKEDPAGWAEARRTKIPYLGFLAALSGFAGFKLTAGQLFTDSFHRLHLPQYTAPGDGSDLVQALLPALLGALVGATFLHARAGLTQFVESRLTNPVLQSALGGLAFATLAALAPFVRFSGHHEFDGLIENAAAMTAIALLGIAALKMLACTICLSTGWRGGAIFPLIFAGAAAGYAGHHLQAGDAPSVAMSAGLAAAVAAGIGKPVAAFLILIFMVGTDTLTAISVGVAVGLLAASLSPKPTH